MDVSLEPEDKRSLFFRLMENLFIAFNFKGDKEKTKEIYWDCLECIYSLFSKQEFKQVQKEIMFNSQWFPKPIDMKDIGNRIFKQFCSPKKEKEIEYMNIDLLNYRELPLDEASKKMKDILYKYCERDGVDDFVNSFDMNFRFFQLEDFEYFDQRIEYSKDITCDKIIEFFGRMRELRVEPRHAAIRGLNLPVEADKPPTKLMSDKMKLGIARIMNKQLPKLVMKGK